MKKYILVLLPLFLAVMINGLPYRSAEGTAFAEELTGFQGRLPGQIVTQPAGNVVNIEFSASREEITEEVVSHTVALLAEDVEIRVNRMTVAAYNSSGELIERGNYIDNSRVRLVNKFTFREMYGFTVVVDLIEEENGTKSVIEALDYDVIGLGIRDIPAEVSKPFSHAYEALALNYATSYLGNLPFKQPSLLIIGHEGTTELPTNVFARWKRAKGFEVTFVKRTDIAPNPGNNDIRNFIIDFYQNADNKPDYLLLIGGARTGASLPMPAFYSGDLNDATDQPYGQIEGDDYFPEILVGRLSVGNSTELATIVNKTIAYERDPYMAETDWLTRATVIAGNYASTLPIPITPVLFSEWLVRLFYDYGYTEVDTVFWRPGDPLGTQAVIDAVNRGSQFINYRGWGAAMGWHYPLFHINHLETTIGGRKSQVVSSFVCNTGDYANQYHDPSFGEAWMKMGTPTSPNGAVAFIGPSYLHTSTPYNNAIAAGFHWGIQDEGIRCFGAAVLRGKIEIYNGFPNETEPGGIVEDYFGYYNILSDPSLSMWVLIPEEMNLTLPAQIDQGTNYLDFAAPGLTGGYVTVTRDEENYQTHRIEDDYAFIPLDPEDEGEIILTVTAENFVPVIQTIEITSSENITLLDYDFADGEINPGETITLNATLKNYSSEDVTDVSATLSSTFPEYTTITEDTADFGDIEGGGTAAASFEFFIESDCPHHAVIQFTLDISPTDDVAKFQLLVIGLLFEVEDHVVNSPNGFLDPGETASIEVSIVNIGHLEANGLTAIIEPQSDAVFLSDDQMSFGDVPVGGSATASFEVSAHEEAFVGRQVYFKLNFEDQTGRHTVSYFNTTLGEVTNEHPTGPCSYGYFAYDSHDTSYPYAPVYDWVDIDPENGGPGKDMWLHDDGTVTMDMPFVFRYYGIDYDEISICSNGWVTFIPTEEINFRNWGLPSPITPKGIIAPYWDDLKGLDDVDNEVRVAYYHDQANNRMIISWLDAYNVANLTPEGLEKIQLILEPRAGRDGDIIFQYHTVWNNNLDRNYSTTGIMNHTRHIALEYSFANNYPPSATPIHDGLAIRITTDAPDQYTMTDESVLPSSGVSLRQNYPNPFNPETVIEFSLPQRSKAALEIFNVRGQKVKTLVDCELDIGEHRYVWDGRDASGKHIGSGVYFYRITTPEESKVRRMILMK